MNRVRFNDKNHSQGWTMLVKRAVHTSVFLSMFEGRSVFKAVSRSVVQTRPSTRGAKGKKHRLTSAKHESEECYESVQD